jgi:hypothetical protein
MNATAGRGLLVEREEGGWYYVGVVGIELGASNRIKNNENPPFVMSVSM